MAKKSKAQKQVEKTVKKTHKATVVLAVLFLLIGIAAGVGASWFLTKDDTFELRVVTDRCSVELYADDGKFNLTLATVPDPTNISILPVLLDPGLGIDFEVHKLKSMWE